MMDGDANTVNIKSDAAGSRAYHHGDLREALLSAGMRKLEQRHTESLSLRELARAVGVSATAVYRHFPDKSALMRAIAEQGFTLMGEMQAQAAEGESGTSAFAAIGAAYVRFALKNPAVFRLMFSSAPPSDPFTGPIDALSGPMRLLRLHVASLTPPGMSDQEQKMVSIHAWALVHGLAVLMLDGMVKADEAMIESVVKSWKIG